MLALQVLLGVFALLSVLCAQPDAGRGAVHAKAPLAAVQLPASSHTINARLQPTVSHKKRSFVARPLSTVTPNVALYLPDIPGDQHDGGATSVYYYGPGNQAITTVYALVTGTVGVREGPKTTYMYQGPTEAYLVNVERTVDLGRAKGGVRTAPFNVKCFYSRGLKRIGSCQYMYMSAQSTSIYEKNYKTMIDAKTTITPVAWLVQSMRREAATSGITTIPAPYSATSSAASMSSVYGLCSALIATLLVGAFIV